MSSGDEVATSAPAWNHPRVSPAAMPVPVMSRPLSPMKTVAPGVLTTLTLPPATPGLSVRVAFIVAFAVGTTVVAVMFAVPLTVGTVVAAVVLSVAMSRGRSGREEGERDERDTQQSYQSVRGCCHG